MSILEKTTDQRRALLQAAVTQLKTEFIGIDGIIDEVADCILPWWLFPQHQLRPLIINLWGMTGSGKTALIKRLTELLAYHNYLMRFDMGEFGSSSSVLKFTLTRNLSQFHQGCPIIVLDEFQFAKTIDESGKEVNNHNLRIIWDLLDSGQLIYEPDGLGYYSGRAKRIMAILRLLHKQGATIKNGVVTSRIPEVFDALNTFQFGYGDGNIDRAVTPIKPAEILLTDVFCTGIYEMNQNNYYGYKEIIELMKNMQSLLEVADFINVIYEQEMAFKMMDLSKALIFVVGNLDEAYVMSNNINPDIDADEFRRHTLKITISDIKKALQSRFRNEQIARLGNTHLIYHAFSNQNFHALIAMHLEKLRVLVLDKFKMDVTYSKSMSDLIYAEGVFPTQGVRPVISTLRNMIEGNIAKVVLYREEHAQKTDRIAWDFEADQYVISFFQGKKQIGSLKLPALQKINSLRKSTHNNLQALVAVHEAGHAIVAMYVAQIVPEYVITKTVDTESQGFTYTIMPEDIVTYKLMIDRIKILLGGYVAESFVFGKDMNTTGVGDDLSKVSTIAQQILREYGMHCLPAKYNIHQYGGSIYQFTFNLDMEEQALKTIRICLAAVEKCIKDNEGVFMEIAHHLSNHSRIDKPELIAMAETWHKKHKRKAPVFLDKESYYSFRKQLLARYSGQ
jgi:Peptidase family M41